MQTCQINNLNICHIHLDPFDSTGKIRDNQIKHVMSVYDDKNNSFIVGDFNEINLSDYDEKTMSYMNKYESKYFSKYNILNELDNEYIDLFNNPNKNVYSNWTLKRVDYIMLSKLNDIKIKQKYIPKVNYSDHFPLVLDLEI